MTTAMLTLFASALLQAAPLPPPPGTPPQPPATILVEPAAMMIAGCDANGDARVTRAELTACVTRAYATAEGAVTGRIGYIAFADWALAWLGDRNALPSPFEVDTDGDNRISLAELEARFAQYFDRFDVNHDGVLSRAELVTIRAQAPGQPEMRGKKRR